MAETVTLNHQALESIIQTINTERENKEDFRKETSPHLTNIISHTVIENKSSSKPD